MSADELNMSSQRVPSLSTTVRNQRVDSVYSDAEALPDDEEGLLKNSSAFFSNSTDEETESNATLYSRSFSLNDDDDDDDDYDDDDEGSSQYYDRKEGDDASNDSVQSQNSAVRKKVIYKKYASLDKKTLRKQNEIIFGKLKTVKNKVVTHQSNEFKFRAHRVKKFRIPPHVIDKYRQFIKTPSPRILRNLIRPRIFLDLDIKKVRSLGRICVQLFTEACPEVVLEFVRMSMDHNARQMEITRIYPELCVEGELCFTRKVLNEPLFDYDMSVMDHGFSYGILSFAKCYLAGFKTGVLNFSISFKPLSVLNGERIVFGIVTRGLKVIDMLQDYGSVNGRLMQNIRVANCGMLK